jgi:ABC-type antimicrobial peptide transport system permease subunit
VALQSALVDDDMVRERLLALLAGFFALAALVLAGVGLYGVLSYSVVRRTKEIGIRMALGAKQSSVVKFVVGEIAVTSGVGLAMGLVLGRVLARPVESLLYEVKPGDLGSLALPLALLLAAAALAALRPAWRAARVEPAIALRNE